MTKVKVEILNIGELPEQFKIDYSSIMEQILNSEEFAKFCFGRKFKFTNLSGGQVLSVLLRGNENWNMQEDYEWDVTKVSISHDGPGVVGHCFLGKEGIYSNLDAIKYPWELIGNLSHENCHFLGFKHPYLAGKSWTPWGHKHKGVCYEVGYFFRDMAKKIIENKTMDANLIGDIIHGK